MIVDAACLRATKIRIGFPDFAPAASETPHKDQDEKDDKNDANHAHTAMTKTVAIATKPTAEATDQENDQDDDEYDSNGHDSSSASRILLISRHQYRNQLTEAGYRTNDIPT